MLFESIVVTMIRTYSELITLPTFEERFRYLMLKGEVGRETFGFDRYLNQKFYTSREWKEARRDVIARDQGLDLGCEGHDIHHKILIHHMNPLTPDEIRHRDYSLIDPENLITTMLDTHNAIHYGDESILQEPWRPRTPGDHVPWGRQNGRN